MPEMIQPLWYNLVESFGIDELSIVGINTPESEHNEPGKRKGDCRENNVDILGGDSFETRFREDVSDKLHGKVKQLHPLVDVGKELKASSIRRNSSCGIYDLYALVHDRYAVIEEESVEHNHGEVENRCKPSDWVYRFASRVRQSTGGYLDGRFICRAVIDSRLLLT